MCVYIYIYIYIYISSHKVRDRACVESEPVGPRYSLALASCVHDTFRPRHPPPEERGSACSVCMYVCIYIYIYREREKERFIDTDIDIDIDIDMYVYVCMYRERET